MKDANAVNITCSDCAAYSYIPFYNTVIVNNTKGVEDQKMLA